MFKKATKAKSKARVALFGPSGAGKTFTALRVASGLAQPAGRIAVIDTERGSASKYSDRFVFDVCELRDRTVSGYVEAIKHAATEGYAALIIDSMTHGWHELLTEVEKIAQAKYRGNTWSAWSEGTPKQRAMVDALLDFPGHIIATMRVKTEWQTEQDARGRNRPVRIGLTPEQGKGIEYEFDQLLEISPEHIAQVIKDRSGKYQDQVIDKPGEQFGVELAVWLSDAPVEAAAKEQQSKAWTQQQVDANTAKYAPKEEPPKIDGTLDQLATMSDLLNIIEDLKVPAERKQNWLYKFKVARIADLPDAAVKQIYDVLKAEKDKAVA